MIATNVFKPRNDWNLVSLNCKKYMGNSFENKLRKLIHDNLHFDPFGQPRYRGRNTVKSRHLFIAMMVNHSKKTYAQIGSMFAQDHATVSHAIKVINNYCDTDKQFRELYDRINQKCKTL